MCKSGWVFTLQVLVRHQTVVRTRACETIIVGITAVIDQIEQKMAKCCIYNS